MLFFCADGKWKFVSVLMILFLAATVYLYSTDPTTMANADLSKLKSSIVHIFSDSESGQITR